MRRLLLILLIIVSQYSCKNTKSEYQELIEKNIKEDALNIDINIPYEFLYEYAIFRNEKPELP